MSLDLIIENINNTYNNTNNTIDTTIIETLINEYGINDVMLCLSYLFNDKIEISLFEENNNQNTLKDTRLTNTFIKLVRERDKQCIVCGCHIDYCDVAHLYDYSYCKIDDIIGTTDPENGLLLCKNIHTLFDKKTLIFEKQIENKEKTDNDYNTYKIVCNDKYINDKNCKNINGKFITLSHKASYYLDKKYTV